MGRKITDLPVASVMNSTDKLLVRQGLTSRQVDFNVLQSHLVPIATTAALEDITDAINTDNKVQFKQVGNTTTGRIIYASGTGVGDAWKFLDGTTAHTPV